MSNVGFRIFPVVSRPDIALVRSFADLPVANIADEMNRLYCMDARIKSINHQPLLGTAFTIKTRTGDNLMLHKALDMAQPGEIIVVDAQGDLSHAITGEIMMRQAIKKGISGIIIDGAIRDVEALQKMSIPIYAVGVQPRGPYKNGPGEINVPVCCGGLVVNPGDILVGDDDGIVVIRPTDAEDLLAKAGQKFRQEQKKFTEIDEGKIDRSWVDHTLTELGCERFDR